MSYPYSLPALPYDFSALEPHIDAQTMQIHHGKHHQAYVNNLNAALEKASPELQKMGLSDLLANLAKVPEATRGAVRNNGGGHWNHSAFWRLMGKGKGGAPKGAVAKAIDASFGTYDKFKEQFQAAAMGRFGSGWAWLVVEGQKLAIMSTPNQDNPQMEGKKAILGLDVWEHAYYLKYQNKRADYVGAWWNVVNWDEVAKNFDAK
ncbi:MAG: superoxide dismutase [Gemmatimonadales bacterium]